MARLPLARVALPLAALSAALTACAPPDIAGCWERCGDAQCGTTEGVFLDVTATTIRETAADGTTCTYTYEASGRDLQLAPTGCTDPNTGLPEVVYWEEVARDDDAGQITYTQVRQFSEAAGLDDQVSHYRFQTIACSEVPAAARVVH